MITINKLTIVTSTKKLIKFFQLLEQGFMVESDVGCSLRDFIRERLGLDMQYLESRVQTVFLNHNPVDNLDAAKIRQGSIVALSAAMPGLAGATLRKGGRFAAMRKQLSCDGAADFRSGEKTTVTVKFFNIIAEELGESRFKNGIRIQSSNFIWFMGKYNEELQTHIKSVQLNGKVIDLYKLVSMPWQGDLFLQISTY